jgi:CHAD domain-containing protein
MKPDSMKWREQKTAAENARVFLPEVLLQYLKLGERLVNIEGHPRRLHQLRLATKHIRYGVDMFEPLFGPKLAELSLILRETQQRLGEISDATASEAWLRRPGIPHDTGSDNLLVFLEQKASRQALEFASFWQMHWGTPELRSKWVLYLRRYAGRSGVRPAKAPVNASVLI